MTASAGEHQQATSRDLTGRSWEQGPHKCVAGPGRSDRVCMRPCETQAPRRVPRCPRRARKDKLITRVDHGNILMLCCIVGRRATGARRQGGKMGNNRRRGGKTGGNKICPGVVRLQVGEGTNIYMQVVALVYICQWCRDTPGVPASEARGSHTQ